MKTPQEWREIAKQQTASKMLTTDFIEEIQKDALSDPFAQTTDQQEFEITKMVCDDLAEDVSVWKKKHEEMREKWLSARRHLRAANKGAERNAIILQLAASRINSMNDPLEGKVWWWLSLSDEDMRLRMGELSKQEIRNIRACLRAILGNHKLFKHTKP